MPKYGIKGEEIHFRIISNRKTVTLITITIEINPINLAIFVYLLHLASMARRHLYILFQYNKYSPKNFDT